MCRRAVEGMSKPEDRIHELATGFALGELSKTDMAELLEYLQADGKAGEVAAQAAWDVLGTTVHIRSVIGHQFQDTLMHRLERLLVDGEEMEDEDEELEDTMREILPRHFEAAVRNARRSVSDRDLAQYASFAQTLQQSRAAVTGATGGSLATFAFPQQGDSGMAAGGGDAQEEDDEEDLYS